MRKIDSSGNTDLAMRFSSRAEAKSRPKGFSTMTRAWSAKSAAPSPVITADHQAVSTVHPPDSAAGPDVHVLNAVRAKFGGPTDIIVVVGIAAVDDHVVVFEERDKCLQHWIDRGRRHHHPDGAGFAQLTHEVLDRRCSHGPLVDECLNSFRMEVVNNALVPGAQKAPHHVGSHPAQSDHAQFHVVFLSRKTAILARRQRQILASSPKYSRSSA